MASQRPTTVTASLRQQQGWQEDEHGTCTSPSCTNSTSSTYRMTSCDCVLCAGCILSLATAALDFSDKVPAWKSLLPGCCISGVLPTGLVFQVASQAAVALHAQVEAFENVWRALVKKGERLGVLMSADKATASRVLGKESESEFQRLSCLNEWGWRRKSGNKAATWNDIDLADVMDELEIPSPGAKAYTSWIWWEDRTIDGITYNATKEGVYENIVSPDSGVIVAYHNFSPVHRGDGRAPKLHHWSDVVFLEWERRAKSSNLSKLRYVLRTGISNGLTLSVIKRALVGCGKKMERWPGTAFGMDTEEGKALLASPNGHGIAWLLIEHKEAFGPKVVKSVRIFMRSRYDADEPFQDESRQEHLGVVSLLFEIGDVDMASEAEGAGAEGLEEEWESDPGSLDDEEYGSKEKAKSDQEQLDDEDIEEELDENIKGRSCGETTSEKSEPPILDSRKRRSPPAGCEEHLSKRTKM